MEFGRIPRRLLIIVNPAAGRARSARLGRTLAALERLGCSVVVRIADALGDAERLARAVEPGFDLVVAAGGDGTIDAVANGLAGSSLALAVLPLGTANVLANEIGLPRAPAALAAVIAAAAPRPVWPGRVDGRLFLMMAGAGFDAEVVAGVDRRLKLHLGKLAFVWAILLCLRRHRRQTIIVEVAGEKHRVAAAVIAKGRRYAGRFVLAPAARIADPVLHVVLFRRAGRRAALRYVVATALGIAHRLPDVSVLATRRVALADDATDRRPGDTPGVVHADGEIVARLPVIVELADAPLLLVQPEAAPRCGCRIFATGGRRRSLIVTAALWFRRLRL